MAKKRTYSHKRLSRPIYSHQRIVFNSKPQCQRITANFTGITRNDSMDGKDYLVAPMVMIVEGVLPGSSGPLYYPASELSKTPQVWNMKPVVVDHPSHNGLGISACDPDIIKNRGVGLVMNTIFEDGKLKAEAWIDINKAEQIESSIVEAIENNEVMELSTGLYTDTEATEGEFNGKDYTHIARNYRPDHLALLPTTTGACSVADGAGFMRLNEAKDGIEISIKAFDSKIAVNYFKANKKHIGNKVREVIENELSHSDEYSLLSSLLRESDESLWIDEVFDSFIIYIDNGALYKIDYSINDGKATFIGSREAVTRKIVFETETGKVLNNSIRKVLKMEKDKLVEAIIANAGTQFTETDKDALMAMDEATLNKMLPVESAEKAAVTNVVNNTEVETLQTPVENKVQTTQEYIDSAPPEVAAVLNANMATYNAQCTELVTKITANKKNTFTKEQLAGKDLAELQGIAALAVNTEVAAEPVVRVNFTGQHEVVTENEDGAEKPLEMATMDFS